MANRIKILVDYSYYSEPLNYSIYRQDSVNPQSLVAEINEALAEQVSVSVIGEVLIQDPQVPMLFNNSKIYLTDPEPKVYVDGVVIDNSNITYMPFDKSIMISNTPIYLQTTQVITMDYSHTSLKLVDNDHYQEGVTYIGPVAMAIPDAIIDRIEFLPNMSAKIFDGTKLIPVDYTYQIKATTKDNKQSFSVKRDISLTFNPIEWILEYTLDGINWSQRLSVNNPELLIDAIPTADKPSFTNVIQVIPTTPISADLIIPNPWYGTMPNRKTYNYRIRVVDSMGITSEPSESKSCPLDMIYIENKLLKIRRYLDVNTPASFDDYDSVDVYILTVDDVDVTAPNIILVDDHLSPDTAFGWTFYLVDIDDVISNPVYIQASTGGDTA